MNGNKKLFQKTNYDQYFSIKNLFKKIYLKYTTDFTFFKKGILINNYHNNKIMNSSYKILLFRNVIYLIARANVAVANNTSNAYLFSLSEKQLILIKKTFTKHTVQ